MTLMPYVPSITEQEIEESELHYRQRTKFFKDKGIDILEVRDGMVRQAQFANKKVLEIGAGGGYATIVLTSLGFEAVSIDLDKEMLKNTAARLKARNLLDKATFYEMDGSAMEFDDGEFENIVAINIFHHIPNIQQMFSEIDRVLKPKGKILCADFNAAGMKIVNDLHADEGRVHDDQKVSEQDVESYFSALNYNVVRYSETHHWVLVGQKKEVQ